MKKKSALRSQTRQGKPEQQLEDSDDDPPESSGVTSQAKAPAYQGKLNLGATVVEQAIRYPTDLSLLNEARAFSEQIIDILYSKAKLKNIPRTYR